MRVLVFCIAVLLAVALQAETDTSLIETRPPIDEFSSPFLTPHNYPGLPAPIASWLEERGFVIPQYIHGEKRAEYFPINVISGEFIRKGQTDLAVYCTNRKKTGIVIFKNGTVDDPEIMDYYPNLIDYEFSDSDRVEFGCCYEHIATASPESMYEAYQSMKQYGVPVPPPLDHDGICGSVFMGPCTLFYYRYNGKWIAIRAAL